MGNSKLPGERDMALITGATGFLGTAVTRHFVGNGKKVRAAVRSNHQLGQEGADQIIIGDLAAQNDWSAALSEVDVVVHLAGRAHILNETSSDPLASFRQINTQVTLNLAAQAASYGVRRFIFISSIGVNGAATGDVPFKSTDTPQPHSPYAISKWEAEQGLWQVAKETAMEIVVIRPPLIIGKDPKGNLGTLVKFLKKGLPMPFGLTNDNRRDLVSETNLANLIFACAYHAKAAGQTFLASDGKPLSTKSLIQYLAALHGMKVTMLPVPKFAIAIPLQILGKQSLKSQLFGNLEVDISKTRNLLDWSPNPPY